MVDNKREIELKRLRLETLLKAAYLMNQMPEMTEDELMSVGLALDMARVGVEAVRHSYKGMKFESDGVSPCEIVTPNLLPPGESYPVIDPDKGSPEDYVLIAKGGIDGL